MKTKSPKKSKTSKHSHRKIMDQVKIKRVKRGRKNITTKEKILAGLGLGATLLGGAAAVSQQPKTSEFVKTQTTEEGSATKKAKNLLTSVFGAETAQAAGIPNVGRVTTPHWVNPITLPDGSTDNTGDGNVEVGDTGDVTPPASDVTPPVTDGGTTDDGDVESTDTTTDTTTTSDDSDVETTDTQTNASTTTTSPDDSTIEATDTTNDTTTTTTPDDSDVETTDSGTVDNTTTDDGAIEADDTADPAAAAINSQTATQPVFSGAVTSDKNGNNTDGLVSPGGKITLTGSGLSAYSSFALQIDGKVYSITQANISSNQAVLTVPLNLPGTIQTGDVVLVQASSTVQGVASGVLNLSFNYQAPSAAADLDTGADTDVETADSGDTAAAAGDSDVESTDTADNASTSTGDSDVETADSDTASGTTAQYASSHNVSSGVSAFGVVDGMAGLQMPTGYSASGDNGLQMSSGDEELQDSEDVEVSADDSQGQGPAAQGSRQSAQQGAQGSYTVKGGDTLWNIAKKYYGNGSKWRTILEANPNCLSRPGDTRTLKIGAQLVIPKV